MNICCVPELPVPARPCRPSSRSPAAGGSWRRWRTSWSRIRFERTVQQRRREGVGHDRYGPSPTGDTTSQTYQRDHPYKVRDKQPIKILAIVILAINQYCIVPENLYSAF